MTFSFVQQHRTLESPCSLLTPLCLTAVGLPGIARAFETSGVAEGGYVAELQSMESDELIGLVRRVERLSDASPERSSSHVSRTIVAGHLGPSKTRLPKHPSNDRAGRGVRRSR